MPICCRHVKESEALRWNDMPLTATERPSRDHCGGGCDFPCRSTGFTVGRIWAGLKYKVPRVPQSLACYRYGKLYFPQKELGYLMDLNGISAANTSTLCSFPFFHRYDTKKNIGHKQFLAAQFPNDIPQLLSYQAVCVWWNPHLGSAAHRAPQSQVVHHYSTIAINL